jgi:hypothetical protein
MTGRVIQGSFLGGRARLPASVAQPKAMPRPPGPPVPAFAGRPAVAQRQGAGDAFEVDPVRLGLVSAGGRPLPDVVRGSMETVLGADFSGVRVHVGPQADRVDAIAFTVGSDIYFAPGRYQPETVQGRQLLGHELAHVVQQRQGRVRNPLGSGVAVVQDHALEAEADRLGWRAATVQPKAIPGTKASLPPAMSRVPGGFGPENLRPSVAAIPFPGRQGTAAGAPPPAPWNRTGLRFGNATVTCHACRQPEAPIGRSPDGPVQRTGHHPGVFTATGPYVALLKAQDRKPPAPAGSPALRSAGLWVAQPMKRKFEETDDKYYADPAKWDPDASDSESEPEDDERQVRPTGAKKRKLQHLVIFNTTKRSGFRRHKGRFRTKRNKSGTRAVPRVNNRLYSVKPWPSRQNDAHTIHDVIPKALNGKTNRSYGATTVLCCVFVVRGTYRKLCFSNSKGAMGTALRNKAHQLGYQCVQAMQAHAEAEMVQYIDTYKDISLVDMGCDKDHCWECTRLLHEYGDRPFKTQSASSVKTYKNYYMPKPLRKAVGFKFRPKEEFEDDYDADRDS